MRDEWVLCHSSAVIGASVLYLVLHWTAYILVLRRRALFTAERGIFLYHLVSAVLFSSCVLALGLACADPSTVAAALAMIALHGIYSVSVLELWSLAQGSYSIGILVAVLQRGPTRRDRLEEELTHIGQRKKEDRLAGLSRLRLIRREGEFWGLTRRGLVVSHVLHGLVCLVNTEGTG